MKTDLVKQSYEEYWAAYGAEWRAIRRRIAPCAMGPRSAWGGHESVYDVFLEGEQLATVVCLDCGSEWTEGAEQIPRCDHELEEVDG